MKMPRNEDIIDDDNDVMELEGHISQTVSPQARRTVEYLFCVSENRVPCNFCNLIVRPQIFQSVKARLHCRKRHGWNGSDVAKVRNGEWREDWGERSAVRIMGT